MVIAVSTVMGFLRQVGIRLIAPVAALYALMVALGLLVTRVLDNVWPLTVEDGVNRQFAAERSETGNTVSLVYSTIANTQVIVIVTAVVALALLVWLRQWREPVFVIGAVSAQALVFLFTTLAIDRQRPAVEHMDGSLPTSSFPSGHTSAAAALYCGLALVLAMRTHRPQLKVAWWALLVTIPIGVALTRMYRGMHHPSDVIGSFLNACGCLIIMARAFLDRTVHWGRKRMGHTAGHATPSVKSRAGVEALIR